MIENKLAVFYAFIDSRATIVRRVLLVTLLFSIFVALNAMGFYDSHFNDAAEKIATSALHLLHLQ